MATLEVSGMDKGGLTKMIEECGELIQIAAKKQAFMQTDDHPDGKGSMKERLEEEIADVVASTGYVVDSFGLDKVAIFERVQKKQAFYASLDAKAQLAAAESAKEALSS